MDRGRGRGRREVGMEAGGREWIGRGQGKEGGAYMWLSVGLLYDFRYTKNVFVYQKETAYVKNILIHK